MKKKIILMVMLVSGAMNAQFRFSNYPWNSSFGTIIKYDKIEHCIGSAFLYQGCKSYDFKPKTALLLTIGIGFLWEVKDGLVPCEKYGSVGGEGFCWKDLTADIIGTVLSYEFDKLHWKIKFIPYYDEFGENN